jgi:HSP20 family protein
MYNRLYYKYTVNDQGLNFNIELAGKSKEDVKVFREEEAIVVKVNDQKYIIGYEDFAYSSLYDYDSVKAKMKNGLLTITVPKIKKIEKQIEIE